jgi:hypothetical protein
MDRVYAHVTRQMRERLYAVLEELWQDAQRTSIPAARSHSQTAKISDLATRSDTRRLQRPAS